MFVSFPGMVVLDGKAALVTARFDCTAPVVDVVVVISPCAGGTFVVGGGAFVPNTPSVFRKYPIRKCR